VELQVNRKDPWIVIDVFGRIDTFNNDLVADKLENLVRIGKRYLAINLSEVTFMNLSAVRSFANTAKKLQARNGKMALIGASDRIVENLRIFLKQDSFDAVENIESLAS
jgi:anti-anti-sigma factor